MGRFFVVNLGLCARLLVVGKDPVRLLMHEGWPLGGLVWKCHREFRATQTHQPQATGVAAA